MVGFDAQKFKDLADETKLPQERQVMLGGFARVDGAAEEAFVVRAASGCPQI
jgi:hypothetical protein